MALWMAKIVVQTKCPYMGGNPYLHRKVPIINIPHCQLEIYVKDTTKCQFVGTGPQKEHVYHF